MMHALAVRAAERGDLEEIVALRLALLREYGDVPLYASLHPDVSDRARDLYFSQLMSSDEIMLLAERDRRVVGMLRCVDTLGSPLLLPPRYCYVSSVYVRPEERRRGTLRALMDAAEHWCAERGLGEMRLHNAASAPTAAAVWDTLGFEVVEQVRRRVLPSASALRDPSTRAAHERPR